MLSPIASEVVQAFVQTCYMVLVSGTLSVLCGAVVGILLYLYQKQGITPKPWLWQQLNFWVNLLRSVPFIILMIALIPFTRIIIGTSIGSNAAIVSLTIGCIPFFARLFENSLNEVPQGLIEAGTAMGASPKQLIINIVIPEAIPSIINNVTVTLITLISYSAIAGAVGGGGLGDLAIRYNQRYQLNVVFITVIILIVLVQLIQYVGDRLLKHYSH